jgi:hypothetical protein
MKDQELSTFDLIQDTTQKTRSCSFYQSKRPQFLASGQKAADGLKTQVNTRAVGDP